MSKIKFLFATGGTGGHVFPAVAVANKLDKECVIISDKRASCYLKKTGLNVSYISIWSTRFKIRFFASLLPSVLRSIFLIIKHKPQKVVGFGGYATFPVLIAALLCGRQIILHESNTVIGKVNKFFLPFAKKVLLGMPVKDLSSKYQKKCILIGNPVRDDFINAESLQRDAHLNILITGGSQAASLFAKKIPPALIEIAKSSKIKIIQQCKKHEICKLKDLYQKNNISCQVSNFFYDISSKMQKADIIICRAGAITIAESLSTKTPMILIPYPFAKDNHQFLNAKFIESKGMGTILEQKDLDEHNIKNAINIIFSNINQYRKNIAQYTQKDTTKRFLAEIKNV